MAWSACTFSILATTSARLPTRRFRSTPEGVWSTQVGYAGGHAPNPTYRQVCGGDTGHAEVVRVVFDPERVSFDEALQKNLRVMDQTAIALCRENRMPVVVFDMSVPGNLRRVAAGEKIGTRVGE